MCARRVGEAGVLPSGLLLRAAIHPRIRGAPASAGPLGYNRRIPYTKFPAADASCVGIDRFRIWLT
ncbi:protein of unknown function [Caballeronia sp. S22]